MKSDRTTIIAFIMEISKKARTVVLYDDHFERFFLKQRSQVKAEILWTIELVEDIVRIPETYFKRIEHAEGLYEIRVQNGNEIFRLFCLFDDGLIVILLNAYQKKSRKLSKLEIDKALKIKSEYENENKNIRTLEAFKEKHYGKRETSNRDALELGYKNFKIGVLLHDARLLRDLT